MRGTKMEAARRGSVLLFATALLAAGCSTATDNSADSEAPQAGPANGEPVAEETPEVAVSDNVSKKNVAVDTTVQVGATNGTLKRVRVDRVVQVGEGPSRRRVRPRDLGVGAGMPERRR